MSLRRVQVKAFAKVNLGLRVLYKRPDGFHELRTVFQSISLADELGIAWEPAESTSIDIDGTPHILDNLVERASKLVLAASGLTGAVHIELRKNIPEGAGLGGGSSDAAALLLALPVLTGYSLSMGTLGQLAAKLGSDVPFFLYGGTALGLGRGEELYPLPDRKAGPGLLVAAQIHSSTAEAYKAVSADLKMPDDLTSNWLQNKLIAFQQEVWQGGTSSDGNDFEKVVFARHPELGRIKDRLLELGAVSASMSGSGSSLFGMFKTPEAAEKARHSFREMSFSSPPVSFSLINFSFIDGAEYRTEWRRALQDHLQGNEWPPQSLYAR